MTLADAADCAKFMRPRAALASAFVRAYPAFQIARSSSATAVTRSRQPDVETLACAVAGGYAARWARGAARAHDADAPAPWLVDGFAGADLQRAALRGTPAQAPAAAFVRAADEAFGGAARVVLVEEDPGLLARLEEELRAAGLDDDRLRRASGPADADAGDVALIESSFASVAARLAGEVADAPALVRLAPLSARALPWGTLELLADLSGADLLLRFPGEDFARAGRFTGPLADFPPHLRRVVEGCSAFLGDERHGWLMEWRAALRAGGEEAALAEAVERLRARLGNGGGARTARAARLESAGGAVHLLLSTPHPEHALELNGAVMDGGGTPAPTSRPPRAPARARPSAASASASATAVPAAEPAPAPVPESTSADLQPSAPSTPDEASPSASADLASVDSAPADAMPAVPPAAGPEVPAIAPAAPAPDGEPTMLDLFAAPAEPAAPEPPRGPDLRAVADDLHARHVGRRVPLRELLVDLADAGLAPEQVRTALGMLKRDRRAAYRSLDADGAEVEFHEPPAAPPSPPAPKPKKARKPVPGLLGLFDEPEDADDAGAEPEPSAAPPPADDGFSAPPGERPADASSWADEPMSLEDAIFPDDPPPPAQAARSPPAKKPRRRKGG